MLRKKLPVLLRKNINNIDLNFIFNDRIVLKRGGDQYKLEYTTKKLLIHLEPVLEKKNYRTVSNGYNKSNKVLMVVKHINKTNQSRNNILLYTIRNWL